VAGQCQNLPRITPGNPKPTDALRRSMRAPAGYVVGVADQSGIELRVNHFLWKVPSSMALYEASPDKGDLYRAFASENLYGVPPDEITKPQRQVGKIAQLGLGFGAGSVTFQRVAKIMGGIDLPLESEDPDVMSATRVVDVWRAAYPEIVKGWKRANLCLTYIPKGIEAEVDPWGLVHTCREGFVLPSGRLIRYPDLRDEDDGQWADGRPKRSAFYGQGRHKARITGPKAVENIVQALARDSIFDCALEFFKRTGLRPSLRVHDELVYVFPKPQGSALLDELQSVMRTPPKWWPQLVVWSEGDLADTYGDAK
jgi:DNA polymerase